MRQFVATPVQLPETVFRLIEMMLLTLQHFKDGSTVYFLIVLIGDFCTALLNVQ